MNKKKTSKALGKGDIVAKVASDAGLSNASAKTAVDSALDFITGALKKKQNVSLVGFGTFSVTMRAAREGRNPQTGESIKIKAQLAPKFKPGKALKDAVNKKK